MEAHKQANDRIKPSVGLGFVDTLQTFFHFVVAVGGNVRGGELTFVHEGLEGDVPTTLELGVVPEGVLDHGVYLGLEFKQSSSVSY